MTSPAAQAARFVLALAVMVAARDAAAGGDCLPRAVKGEHPRLGLDLGMVGGAPVACVLDHLDREVIPYQGAPMIAQRDGTIVVELLEEALGQLAILDAATMRETRRVRLPFCRNR